MLSKPIEHFKNSLLKTPYLIIFARFLKQTQLKKRAINLIFNKLELLNKVFKL
jgi:hypothetical protein